MIEIDRDSEVVTIKQKSDNTTDYRDMCTHHYKGMHRWLLYIDMH